MSVSVVANGGAFPRITGARPLMQAAPWERGAQAAQTRVMPQTMSPLALRRKNNPANKVPEKVLLAAAERTCDPYWAQVLREAALGKWPRGFKFRSGILTFQQRTKVYEEPINDDMDPAEVSERIVKFIKMRGDRQSERDRERVTSILYQSVPTSVGAEGGGDEAPKCRALTPEAALKFKRCHPALFSRYVQDRGREHGLNLRARSELLSTLQFCESMGWLNSRTIEFEEEEDPATSHWILPRIRSIKCIEFIPGAHSWVIRPVETRPHARSSAVTVTEGDSGPFDQLCEAVEAAIEEQRERILEGLYVPNEIDFSKYAKIFFDHMKSQRVEQLLGMPLKEGEYLYSAVRNARDASRTDSPRIDRTPVARTPVARASSTPSSVGGTKAPASHAANGAPSTTRKRTVKTTKSRQ